ncbi:YdcF family protein [Sphingomonas sp. CJ20]
MIWRTLLLLVVAWVLGFAIFMISLGKPLDDRKTDAIVVVTGGPGRIDRGIAVLTRGDAKRMLVSGVDPDVKPVEFAVQYKIDRTLFSCCIDLGWQAVDTRSNAEETQKWVARHGFKSIRLVTTDWHMPRARMELAHALGGDVEILGDGVRSTAGFQVLFREYHKYLVRRIALLLGAG